MAREIDSTCSCGMKRVFLALPTDMRGRDRAFLTGVYSARIQYSDEKYIVKFTNEAHFCKRPARDERAERVS